MTNSPFQNHVPSEPNWKDDRTLHNPPAPQPNPPAAPQPSSGNGFRLAIFGMIFIVLIALAATFFLLSGSNEDNIASSEETGEEESEPTDNPVDESVTEVDPAAIETMLQDVAALETFLGQSPSEVAFVSEFTKVFPEDASLIGLSESLTLNSPGGVPEFVGQRLAVRTNETLDNLLEEVPQEMSTIFGEAITTTNRDGETSISWEREQNRYTLAFQDVQDFRTIRVELFLDDAQTLIDFAEPAASLVTGNGVHSRSSYDFGELVVIDPTRVREGGFVSIDVEHSNESVEQILDQLEERLGELNATITERDAESLRFDGQSYSRASVRVQDIDTLTSSFFIVFE